MGNRLLQKFFADLESYICCSLLILFVILLFAQIISRELFGHSFSWSEELATYMFVWFVFFGASYAAKLGAHNRVTFQFKSFPKQVVNLIEGFADLLWLMFNLYFIWLSVDYIVNMNKFWKSQTLGIHMSWVFLIFPLAFTLMSIRIIQVNYYKLIKGIDVQDPEKAEVEKMLEEGLAGNVKTDQ